MEGFPASDLRYRVLIGYSDILSDQVCKTRHCYRVNESRTITHLVAHLSSPLLSYLFYPCVLPLCGSYAYTLVLMLSAVPSLPHHPLWTTMTAMDSEAPAALRQLYKLEHRNLRTRTCSKIQTSTLARVLPVPCETLRWNPTLSGKKPSGKSTTTEETCSVWARSKSSCEISELYLPLASQLVSWAHGRFSSRRILKL